MTALDGIAVIDCETITLDPDQPNIVWEVAAIIGAREYVWQLPVNLQHAEAAALTVGRFYERRWPQGDVDWLPTADDSRPHRHGEKRYVLHPANLAWWCLEFAELTHGLTLCGAVPSFDEERLRRLLRANGACPGWRHRLIDVESVALGWLAGKKPKTAPPVPPGLTACCQLLGITITTEDAHTALGDARAAQAVYRHCTGAKP